MSDGRVYAWFQHHVKILKSQMLKTKQKLLTGCQESRPGDKPTTRQYMFRLVRPKIKRIRHSCQRIKSRHVNQPPASLSVITVYLFVYIQLPLPRKRQLSVRRDQRQGDVRSFFMLLLIAHCPLRFNLLHFFVYKLGPSSCRGHINFWLYVTQSRNYRSYLFICNIKFVLFDATGLFRNFFNCISNAWWDSIIVRSTVGSISIILE
jgi:hypothetical protein